MRQQLVDVACLVGGQPREHIFQIHIGIVAIEFGRLDQARDRCRTLAGQQRTGKQPIFPASRPDSHLLFIVIVVDGQRWIVEVAHQRSPPSQAVIDGFGRSAAVNDPRALGDEPQCLRDRLGMLLDALFRLHILDLALDADTDQ